MSDNISNVPNDSMYEVEEAARLLMDAQRGVTADGRPVDRQSTIIGAVTMVGLAINRTLRLISVDLAHVVDVIRREEAHSKSDLEHEPRSES